MPKVKKGPSRLYKRIVCSSIKSKVVTLVALLLSLSFIAAGVGTSQIIKNQLVDIVDKQLIYIKENKNSFTMALQEKILGANTVGDNYQVAIYDLEGKLVWSMPGQNNLPEFVRPINKALYDETVGKPFSLACKDGQGEHRLILVMADFTEQTLSGIRLKKGIITYSFPQSSIDNAVSAYSDNYILLRLIIFGLALLAAYLIVSYALSPFKAFRRTARAFAAGDYSERVKTEYASAEVMEFNENLNTMLDKLEAAFVDREKTLQQMRRFLGDASHELRTPLVSLRGYAELYRMGALKTKEDVSNAIDRIEKEAIRMGDMVEDLLSLTRLEQSADIVPIDVKVLVCESIMDARVRDKERKITAEICSSDCTILGNENMIRQLLTNLLSNATHYTPPKSPIEVMLGGDNSNLIIEVRDHGPGIPEQLRETVFKRFWRSDCSRSRNTGGTGLGLSIVESIVNIHRGTIEILTTEGGGATFRITIPKLTQV